jgi:hypothetical protein
LELCLDSKHSAEQRAILARLSAGIPIINRQKDEAALAARREGKWVLA